MERRKGNERRNTDQENIWLTKMPVINFCGFQKNPPNVL